jgi:hypothetical protein
MRNTLRAVALSALFLTTAAFAELDQTAWDITADLTTEVGARPRRATGQCSG